MKKFNAEMKVVRFGAEDVIVTSGKSLTLSNVGDDKPSNNSMEFGGVTYSRQNCSSVTIRNHLSDYFDSSLKDKTPSQIMFYINSNESKSLSNVWIDNNVNNSYNGKYTYADGSFYKQ
ncbi:MAG: hypothetical protein IKQ00_08775 [Butyrivibrio sp.]|nr:hypothetical protein [Butyrivibrio sp.]